MKGYLFYYIWHTKSKGLNVGADLPRIEHCSANVEATGSNPVEVSKNLFRATSQLLKLRFTAMVTYSFHL